MSCRVHLPDETPPIEPVVWRSPASPGGGDSPAPADEAIRLRAQAAQLQQQYEQKVREAHATGVREGEAAGRSRAMAEMQPVLDRLARSIDELASLRGRLRDEAETDLVQLSVAIARRVLRREIALDPEALHGLILGALAKLQGQEITRVRVHPAHAGAVEACLKKSLSASQVEIAADPSCDVGGIVFETARGNLDASVESQLQEIERGLADRLGRR